MPFYVKALETFSEHKISYFDAAKQPDMSIARYCSTLGCKLWHITVGKIQFTKCIINSGIKYIGVWIQQCLKTVLMF